MEKPEILRDQAALDTCLDFLEAFKERLERTEPHAVNAIQALDAALEALPRDVGDID